MLHIRDTGNDDSIIGEKWSQSFQQTPRITYMFKNIAEYKTIKLLRLPIKRHLLDIANINFIENRASHFTAFRHKFDARHPLRLARFQQPLAGGPGCASNIQYS